MTTELLMCFCLVAICEGRAAASSVVSNFRLVPGGLFQMGDNLDGLTDAPVHFVNVSSFWMDRFEVTGELWNEVAQWGALHEYVFGQTATAAEPTHPVGNLNWYDAVKWCNARSEMEGRTPAYYTDSTQTNVYRKGNADLSDMMVKWNGPGYRLPTEAEWEKAARGGLGGKRYPWGDDVDGADANYSGSGDPFEGNTIRSTPVGYYDGKQIPQGPDMANGYGLYDMMGNALEWCWDWYGPYSTAAQTDPHGPFIGGGRLLRGGSWNYAPVFARNAYRYNYTPRDMGYSIGFRTVLGTVYPTNWVILDLRFTNDFPALIIYGPTGSPLRLETSSNLGTTNWTAWQDLSLTNSPFMLIDSRSSNMPIRFYRVIGR